MKFQSFIGPSNVLASPFLDAEDAINLMQITVAPGIGKTDKGFIGTPCVNTFAQGPDGPVRGNGAFQLDGRAFAVCGEFFIEVFSNGTTTNYGSVGTDGRPVSICSNGTAGNQIFIVSNSLGFIFNTSTNTLTQIVDADFPADAIQCEFMDGYFLVLIENTRRFQISALEDGTSWDALDVAEISEAADNVVSMKRNHREIWFLGSQTGEAWYDNGDPLFPFAPIQGVFIENGSAGPFAICRADNTVFWLDRDERGAGIVRKGDGYTPSRVSTYAIEHVISLHADLSEALMFAQQDQGHLFVWLLIPDASAAGARHHYTLVYDVAEDRWHKRGIWNSTTCFYEPYVANSHMYAFGKHLVGDRNTEWIYDLSFAFFEDEVVVA